MFCFGAFLDFGIMQHKAISVDYIVILVGRKSAHEIKLRSGTAYDDSSPLMVTIKI